MNKIQEGISIILPVYNCEQYIKDSIKSILEQTYENFELIIINDGSTDRSEEIIKTFNDHRINYYYQKNEGLSKSINKGIRLAKYEYIARQDADDISLPKRLEKLVLYLKSHPDCFLVGSWAQIIKKDNLTNRYLIHPTTHTGCIYKLLFDCCFTHTSVLIKKSIFEEVGFFNEDNSKVPPVDYEMWSRISKKAKVSNIPEVLVYFRENPSSISFNKPYLLRSKAATISTENIIYLAGKQYLKEARTIAEIYFQLNSLSYKFESFYKLKKVLISIIENIESNQSKKVNLYRDLDIFIIKLKLKWLINYTYIKYIYNLIKPIIQNLSQTKLLNKIFNLISSIFC